MVQDEAIKEMGDSPRQWMERLHKQISGKHRAAHGLQWLSGVHEEASRCDQLDLGTLTCLEGAARRLHLTVHVHKQGGARFHVSAKCLAPIADTDSKSPGTQVNTSTGLGSDAKHHQG